MKKLITLLAFALLVSFGMAQPTVDGTVADGEYAASITEEESGTVVSWTLEGDTVYFAVQGPAEGWIGFGFIDETGNRKAGFDQYIFAIEDGALVAYDMFQDRARGEPVMDEEEGGSASIAEFAGSHDGSMWVVEFSRPADTGEETDTAVAAGMTAVGAIAFGDTMDHERDHDRSSRGGAYYIEGMTF